MEPPLYVEATALIGFRAEPMNLIFSAGDVSGDIYAARLAGEVLKHHPDWTIHAVGGQHLARAINGEMIGDSSRMSAMGISEGILIWPRGRVLSWRLREFMRANPVDLVVLCDWGYFNCGQFRFLRALQVPTLYYFPPSSWWRHGTAGLGIVPWVTRVATPFSWSAKRLAGAGCDAEWVGHPLLDREVSRENRGELRREFGVRGEEELIAFFPGSRLPELKVLGPKMAKVAELLRKEREVRFVVPVPENLADQVSRYFPSYVKFVPGRGADALTACDAAVVKTGTSTLEATVIGAPQIAIYDIGWMLRLEWMLLWTWKRIPFIAMPNIILERMAVPELLGPDSNPEAILIALKELLDNEVTRGRMQEDYREIRRLLGSDLEKPATLRVAEIIEEMLIPERDGEMESEALG